MGRGILFVLRPAGGGYPGIEIHGIIRHNRLTMNQANSPRFRSLAGWRNPLPFPMGAVC
jgi:hypothetical protein